MSWRTTATTICRDLVLNRMLASMALPNHHRWRLLRRAGLPVQRSTIAGQCFFGGYEIVISPGCMVNYGVFFDGSGPVRLGRNVHVGMQSMFCTSGHSIGNANQRAGGRTNRGIAVGDGTWIGARVVVLPGVTIGAGCVIAAGSVVIKDCAPNGVYGGNPARRLRDM